jgi:hypothetical protein
MNNKKFAPLIGKELTWAILDKLLSEMRKELKGDTSGKKARKKKSISASMETEDDGA